jgi:hypothetical protein
MSAASTTDVGSLTAAVEWAVSCWRADVAPNLPSTTMEWVTATFFLVGVVSIATAVLPWLASLFFFRQSLKKRYNASWALVTGERGRARAQMDDC